MAVNLTYNLLLEQLPSYCENPSATLLAQLPTSIMLAENRIATDMKQQGFQSVVSGTFTLGNPNLAKPAFWRETISFVYTDPVEGEVPLHLRSLEYVRQYWPTPAERGAPRFYADHNFSNFLIAPTPVAAYDFELAYYARLQPLDASNQTNWLTNNAPQVLLAACLLEVGLWLKTESMIARWQGQYDLQKGSMLNENAERLADRTEVVTRA